MESAKVKEPSWFKFDRETVNDLYEKTLLEGDPRSLRRLCCEDLFFLLTIACKRRDINRQWLFERCREIDREPDGYLDLWAREHYKDLACDTPVLTTKGWKNHGDLREGDFVFSPEGKAVKVLATKFFTDSSCHKITFDNGIQIVAGAGHEWDITYNSRKRISGSNKRVGRILGVLNTKEILENFNKVNGIGPYISSPIISNFKKLEIDPYVLGAWLGDGYSANGTLCGIDHDIFREIEKRGYEIRFRKIEENRHKDYRICLVKGLTKQLHFYGLVKNKHIPIEYMLAGYSQRLDLLRGLMDTDGSINSSKSSFAVFANADKNLAEQVQTLAISLGFKARLTPCRTTNSWHVCFALQGKIDAPVLLKRKLEKIKKVKSHNSSNIWFIKNVEKISTVKTNCIQVEGGKYLAGKQLIPTRNSTIITFGKTIQDILCNPNITVGIFSHTRPIAKGFLSQIKRELEDNTFLKDLFPDVLYKEPRKESSAWSMDTGIIVKRKSNPKECTVEAWGLVDGQPTSKHFSLLVYDDVVTRESVTTPEQIDKVTDAWALSLNLGARGGKRRLIGTRYHFNDTWGEIIKREAAIPRIKPATEDGTVNGKPVFLSRENLDDKIKDFGGYVFSCQMLQNPAADRAMGFQKEWLLHYDKLQNHENWNYYLLVDPASKKKRGSDYTVFAVIGLAPDNNYYLVDGVRDRLNLTERAKKLFQLHRKWRPRAVGYESYGMQADVEHMKYVMEQEGYRFRITELGGSIPKEDRIRKLVPIFEQGRFYIPHQLHYLDYEKRSRDFVSEFINDEYLAFPVATHDDMLDNIARIVDPELKAVFPEIETDLNYATENSKSDRAETEYDLFD